LITPLAARDQGLGERVSCHCGRHSLFSCLLDHAERPYNQGSDIDRPNDPWKKGATFETLASVSTTMAAVSHVFPLGEQRSSNDVSFRLCVGIDSGRSNGARGCRPGRFAAELNHARVKLASLFTPADIGRAAANAYDPNNGWLPSEGFWPVMRLRSIGAGLGTVALRTNCVRRLTWRRSNKVPGKRTGIATPTFDVKRDWVIDYLADLERTKRIFREEPDAFSPPPPRSPLDMQRGRSIRGPPWLAFPFPCWDSPGR